MSATCEQHVASRYSKLLASLWFEETDAPRRQGATQGPAAVTARRPSSGRAFVAEHAAQDDGLSADNFNLDVGLGWGAPGDSFTFNDSVGILSGSFAPQNLSFPGISLPGLNGADLSSLLPFDSYQP